MKTSLLLAILLTGIAAEAQVIRGARNYTQRVAPQSPPPGAAYGSTGPAVGGAGVVAGARSAPPTAAQRDAADQKLLDYQLMRAEKGSESAQYELGIRYLQGKGVDPDPAAAKEYFEKSAKSGNTQAKKQLALMAQGPKSNSLTNLLSRIKPLPPATNTLSAVEAKATPAPAPASKAPANAPKK